MQGSSLFDIVGPIMVGPSSSHTAGAVRLGRLAAMIAGDPLQSARLELLNSFAETYKGHGTDCGLLAGLCGYDVADPRIRDLKLRLDQQNFSQIPFDVCIEPNLNKNNFSPNTVIFHLTTRSGQTYQIVGHSVGGGKVYISRINVHHVSLRGESHTLLMLYKDQPGMIWKTTKVIAEENVNIATLQCFRQERGRLAVMNITLDSGLSPAALTQLAELNDVYWIRQLEPLSL
jgi:L-serine dehydratase